jgi:hypothetical protein
MMAIRFGSSSSEAAVAARAAVSVFSMSLLS